MGISGLYTLIKNTTTCGKMIDLISHAELKGGLEILVVFHSFYRDLIEIFTKKIEKDYDNRYLRFPAGEYDLLAQAFSEFHQSFNEAGIKLVWIIDGPKDVDKIAGDHKKQTWIKRDKKDIDHFSKVLEGCQTKTLPKNLHNLGPILGFDIAIAALKEAGAEIIQLLQVGTDEFITSEFHRRQSFAIISGDTDMLIFPNCTVIFPDMMSCAYRNHTLKMPFIDNENIGKFFRKPKRFLCPVVSQRDLLQLLKLTDRSQLIALSIIKGTDNTEEYAKNLQYYLRITNDPTRNAHVTRIADFIRRNYINHENIFNQPGMIQFLETFSEKLGAIQFCIDFYSLEHFNKSSSNSTIVFDPTITDGSLTGYFSEKFSKSEISKKVYSLHCGIYHDLISPELPDCPPIAIIIREVRYKSYPFLLNENLNEVIEWQPYCDPIEVKVVVQHSSLKTNKIQGKPDPESDNTDSENNGMGLFEKVWSHLEPEESLQYFHLFGVGRGFICYMLRYVYQVTKDKNLKISQNEFKSLFLTVFYHYSLSKNIKLNTSLTRDSFLTMRICPTNRCLVLFAWFTNTYFTGKYVCGGAFNLTDDFPIITQLMSGSVFFAFYANAMNDTDERLSHLEDSVIDSIENVGTQIIEKYNSEYDAVTK